MVPHEFARFLADAAIALSRNGARQNLDAAIDALPAALPCLAVLARDNDHLLANEFSTPVIGLCGAVSSLAARAELLAKVAKEANWDNVHRMTVLVLEDLQQALSRMLGCVGAAARRCALGTPTGSDLLPQVIMHALSGAEALPKLLAQFEKVAGPEELSGNEPDTFHAQLAEVLIGLVKHLEDMCERHPERFRGLARELPYWPALVTQHKAGYRARFERITGKGFIDLGAECPLDTSARAMYRLETPVCGLLWEEVFRDWLAVSAEVRALRREARKRNQPPDQEKEAKAIESAVAKCCESDAERGVFRAAFALPELNQATATQWADRFVIPYLQLKLTDWQTVRALKPFVGKHGGTTKAEREIRRAVGAMARR